MPWSEVRGTNVAVKWHHPNAENITTPVADLFVLRDVEQFHERRWDKLDMAWLAEMFQLKHHFAFRTAEASTHTGWFLALDYHKDSGVMSWPLTCDTTAGITSFGLAESPTGPADFTVLDINQWEAVAVECWSWQH